MQCVKVAHGLAHGEDEDGHDGTQQIGHKDDAPRPHMHLPVIGAANQKHQDAEITDNSAIQSKL